MAQMQRVRVLRGFRHKREVQAPKSVLDLEMPIAIEMRSANKVEFVSPQTELTHKTELPDPNKVLADRQAERASAAAPTTPSKATDTHKVK
jgi:hypothetical protein